MYLIGKALVVSQSHWEKMTAEENILLNIKTNPQIKLQSKIRGKNKIAKAKNIRNLFN